MRVHFALLTKYRRDVLPKEMDNMRSIFKSSANTSNSKKLRISGRKGRLRRPRYPSPS